MLNFTEATLPLNLMAEYNISDTFSSSIIRIYIK
jgi:hypothetical protein